MKTLNKILLIFFALVSINILLVAQEDPKTKKDTPPKTENEKKVKHGLGFVDNDGDGYNDNAPDDDGDGIPNGIDPDYKGKKKRRGFVDLDGDGINDNAGFGQGKGKANRFGKNNSFTKSTGGPQSGTVTGAGNESSGDGNQQQSGKTKRKGKR